MDRSLQIRPIVVLIKLKSGLRESKAASVTFVVVMLDPNGVKNTQDTKNTGNGQVCSQMLKAFANRHAYCVFQE